MGGSVSEPDGGDVLVRVMRRHGVDTAFGVVSVHNLPLVGAVARELRFVEMRHEGAAVGAADGYARATGRIGVAITSTGTGAGNAAGALVDVGFSVNVASTEVWITFTFWFSTNTSAVRWDPVVFERIRIFSVPSPFIPAESTWIQLAGVVPTHGAPAGLVTTEISRVPPNPSISIVEGVTVAVSSGGS